MNFIIDPYSLSLLERKFKVTVKRKKVPKISGNKYFVENSSSAEALKEAILNDSKVECITLSVKKDKVKVKLKTIEGESVVIPGDLSIYEVNTVLSMCKLPLRLHRRPGPLLTRVIRGVSYDMFYLSKIKPSIIKLIATWAELHPEHRVRVYCSSKRYVKIMKYIFSSRRNIKVILIRRRRYRGKFKGR